MRVELIGERDGQPLTVRWDLTAAMLHGPEIPCFAAILLVRKLAEGQVLPSGAHACMGLLTLADFEQEFAAWQMHTDVVEARP